MEPPPLPRRPPPPPPRLSSTPPLPPSRVPNMADETLYHLLRRFNKQTTHIEAADIPSSRLDFSPSPHETFTPERLRSNVERVHLSMIKDLMEFGQQMVLLRSWVSPLRTGSFAFAYFLAWQSPIGVASVFFALLALLVVYPPARSFLFPPLPPALLPASPLPSPGEAPIAAPTLAEQQEIDAANFASELAELAQVQTMDREPTMGEMLYEAAGGQTLDEEDRTAAEAVDEATATEKKVKVDRLAKHGLPIQTLMGDLADSWERWSTTLSPVSPPLSPNAGRIRVALHLVPIAVALAIVPTWLLGKIISFAIGIALFGDPAITWGIAVLDATVSGWKEAIELRQCVAEDATAAAADDSASSHSSHSTDSHTDGSSLLALAPSNTQITVTLLRNAETAGMPLPVPPPLATPPSAPRPPPLPARPMRRSGSLDTPDSPELDDTASIASAASVSSTSPPKKSNKDRFASLVRGAAKLGETGAGYASGQKPVNWQSLSRMAVDQLKKSTGSALPEHLMSFMPDAPKESESNSTFYAQRKGVPGHLLVVTTPSSIPPTLKFSPIGKLTTHTETSGAPPATIPLASIVSLRKTTGLGWKGRMALGWTTGLSVGDGVVVGWIDEEGERKEVAYSGIVRRDELFNRLVGLSPKRFFCL